MKHKHSLGIGVLFLFLVGAIAELADGKDVGWGLALLGILFLLIL